MFGLNIKFYVVLAAVALSAVFYGIHVIERRAEDRTLARIERAHTKDRDAADAAQQGPLNCAGTWNRETGKCVD
jgi:hypothetical protein